MSTTRRLLRPPRLPACRPSPRSFCSSSSSLSTSTPTPTPPPPPPSERRRPDLAHPSLRYLQSLLPASLHRPDPLLDLPPSAVLRAPLSPSQRHPATVVHVPATTPQTPPDKARVLAPESGDDALAHLAAVTSLSVAEIRALHRYPLVTKRVVSMKSKGKTPSMYSLVVVGNGRGLVGVGEGNDVTARRAMGKAFGQAVRAVDWVKRKDDRTVWGTLASNFGSTRIEMRERPSGFGLRVNHHIHAVAKAAGLADLSAKVYGARNGTRVVKLAVQMLQGGHVPVDLGEWGRKGARRNKKGAGMRTAAEIARSRGRSVVSV